MEQWLAEERLEEARTQARLALLLRADSHGGSDADQITTDAVQVVEDEDEVTTIRRPVLPDVKFAWMNEKNTCDMYLLQIVWSILYYYYVTWMI